MKIENIIGHFKTITKHKWIVFQLCCKAGIPWRGFMHDWSKYSPTEFGEGIHYYTGKKSPVQIAREQNGYSKAWLHHKGRNRHHAEYWFDYDMPCQTILMPYQYAVEMVCDDLAAGIVYNRKNWTQDTQLQYWNTKGKNKSIHPATAKFAEEVFVQVSRQGIDKTIKKQNLEKIYKEVCNNKE